MVAHFAIRRVQTLIIVLFVENWDIWHDTATREIARDICWGQQTSLSPQNPHNTSVMTVAAVNFKVVATMGRLGEVEVEMMLDSGSFISLMWKEFLKHVKAQHNYDLDSIRTTAAHTEPRQCSDIGELQVKHSVVVVDNLVSPIILGVDFFRKHGPWFY